MKTVKYVQLEPNAFLSDSEFQGMTASERGVYCTLILYLYCNNGVLSLDYKRLGVLCACDDFRAVWERIKGKFVVRGKSIRHKRVTKELKRAGEYIRAQSLAGCKGMAKRWGKDNGVITPLNQSNNSTITKERKVTKAKERKGNTTNTNTDTTLQNLLSSTSLRSRVLLLTDKLCKLIGAKNRSDRTSFGNIAKWLAHQVQQGVFDDSIFERVLDYASEAADAKGNHAAIFTATVKRELGYDKSKNV